MTPASILVVEDQRVVARDIEEQLTRLGYRVVGVTGSGAEAIRLAEQLRPDLVLMDIRLADAIDGVEAAQQIRTCCQLPVVYLTAYADEETLQRAKVTEPYGFVLKPFEERELHTAIEIALYKHQAERQLRESERRYAITLNSIGDGVIATDNQARVRFVNPVAEALTGWRQPEANGRPLAEVFRIVNEQTREPIEDPATRVLQQGTAVELANHTVLLTRDGREVPIDDCGAPVIDDKGAITGAVLVFHDVTEQRQAAKSLTLFRALIDQTNDSIEIIEPDTGRFLDVNEKACLVHGFTRDEYLSRCVSDLDPTLNDPAAWQENVAYLRRFGSRIHVGQHRRRDGSVFPIEANVSYIRLDRDYLLAVVRDTTERQRAEEALRASEARFRTFADHATDAFFLHDDRGRILDVNRQACESLGYTRDELIGMAPDDIDTDVTQAFLERIGARLDAGETITFDSHHRRKDKTVFPVEVRIRSFWEGGRRFGLSLARDITGRKRAEQALQQSHALLRAIIEGTPDAVFVKDREGRYELMNSAGAGFVGKRVDEVIGKDDMALFSPETARDIRARDLQIMATGQPQTMEEVASAASVTRTCLTTKSPLRDAQGNVVGLIGIARDVTELKQLEEQFRQSQKMEAVGRLAGGVAHDFNNLLTVINGFSELVLARLRPDDPSRELIAEIQKAGTRATALTRQLLVFSRKQILQPQVLDLNFVLRELNKMLLRLIGEDIELAVVPGPALGLTKVDPGEFEQAILNLAVNARDAMPRGGKLTIATRNVELDPGYVKQYAELKPGRYVQVAVSDTGQGMDEATRARVFEPFFTTKERGKGTGLGLAMVYGFVKQSGGHIEVDSEPGRGTTFKVYLPRTDEVMPPAKSFPGLVNIPKGTETVLLVEDEEAVRALSRLILQSSGYTVLQARDGQEALWVAQQHPGPIHILVTDLVMPRMSGRQLAEVLAQARPTMRILFTSGYTDEAIMRQGALEPGVEFLPKPYSPLTLSRKVREVLDAPAGYGR